MDAEISMRPRGETWKRINRISKNRRKKIFDSKGFSIYFDQKGFENSMDCEDRWGTGKYYSKVADHQPRRGS